MYLDQVRCGVTVVFLPVICAKGFLLSSGSQRKRVKSSEPDTSLSLLPPWIKIVSVGYVEHN